MISQINQMKYRLNNLDTLQQKLNYQYTGKELESGSDNSILYSRIISVDDKIRTFEGIQTQLERTTVQNNTSDSSMAEIKKILESVNAEMIKANTSTIDGNGLRSIAINIAGMKENLFDLANTRVEGEYVFSGSDSSVRPFERDENGVVSYVGDNKLRKIAVEEGSYRERGINGFDVMMYSKSTAYKGETLTFGEDDRILDQDGNEWKLNSPTNDTLTKFDVDGNETTDTMSVSLDEATQNYSVTAPLANGTKFEAKSSIFALIDNIVENLNGLDSQGNQISNEASKALVSEQLSQISKAYDDVNVAHSDLGSRNKVFDVSLETMSSKITQYKVLSQDLSSSNLTEVALKAKSLEIAYTALYSTISKTNQLSLVNFMN